MIKNHSFTSRLATAVSSSASTAPPVQVRLVESDLVLELVVGKRVFGLLCERVPRDRLERLFHVDGLLRRCFKVGDLVLAVAPLLSTLCRYLQRRQKKKSGQSMKKKRTKKVRGVKLFQRQMCSL